MKIRTRLYLAFGGILLIVVLTSGVILTNLLGVRSELDDVTNTQLRLADLADDIRFYDQTLTDSVRAFLIDPENTVAFDTYFRDATALDEALLEAQELATSAEDRQIFQNIDSVNQELIAIEEDLLANPDIERAIPLYRGRYGELKTEYSTNVQAFFDRQNSVLGEQNASLTSQVEQSLIVNAGLVVLLVFLSIGISIVLGRSILNPLTVLIGATDRIAEGQLDTALPQGGQDELGVLARSFATMVQRIQSNVQALEAGRLEAEARSRDLAATVAVGGLVTSTYAFEELLTNVTDFIQERFNLYYAQIYLLDDAGRYAHLRAGTGDVGQQLLARQHKLNMSETSIVSRAVQGGEPVLVENTETSDIHKLNQLLPDTRSEIAVPMIAGGEILGVLDMQAVAAGTFNNNNLPVFLAMANQVSAALRGAQAFDQAQQAIDRAETVNRRLTHEGWQGYLSSLRAQGHVGYEYDLEAPHRLEAPLTRPPNTTVGEVDADTNGSRRSNGNHGSAPSSNGRQADDQRLAHTITLRGESIGTIMVQDDDVHPWTQEEIALVEGVSERLAQSLEQYRAFDEIERRASELQTVAEVSAVAATELDAEKLLKRVSDLTKTQFNLYHAHVYLYDEENNILRLAAGAGEAGDRMVASGHSIALDHEHSLVASAARTQQGVIVNDVMKNPDFLPNPLLPDTRAEMAIPMRVGEQLIGVLDVQADFINRFSDEDVRIQTALSDQISVAVQNAQTFQQQAETVERLREVDRLKQQFLANMSHELRTPLNSIIGYAEVLLDGIDGDLSEEAKLDVEDIHSSGKHLLAIINDILDLAKIEAGQMQIANQEMHLAEIADDVAHTAQILVKEQPVELILEDDQSNPVVIGDPVRMRQIILNLVSNAAKFTEKGTVTVQIGTLQAEREAYIKVIDTGIGIDQQGLDVIFERFRQVDESVTRRSEGTGLGLAITRELIHMHGGELFAESELNAGSTFWFTLPVVE